MGADRMKRLRKRLWLPEEIGISPSQSRPHAHGCWLAVLSGYSPPLDIHWVGASYSDYLWFSLK